MESYKVKIIKPLSDLMENIVFKGKIFNPIYESGVWNNSMLRVSKTGINVETPWYVINKLVLWGFIELEF